MQDMPHLRKKLAKIDRNRLSRLKEARDTKSIKHMVIAWADEKLNQQILTDKQRMALHLLSDFVHNFTYEYIACKLNVPLSELSKWRNQPLFLRELDKEITRRMSFIRLHAFRNVNRAIMRGSMKDTWKYLQMTGDLKEIHKITDDRTGEAELSNAELTEQITSLMAQLANATEEATTPSDN